MVKPRTVSVHTSILETSLSTMSYAATILSVEARENTHLFPHATVYPDNVAEIFGLPVCASCERI